jgi:hypothetical protein
MGGNRVPGGKISSGEPVHLRLNSRSEIMTENILLSFPVDASCDFNSMMRLSLLVSFPHQH